MATLDKSKFGTNIMKSLDLDGLNLDGNESLSSILRFNNDSTNYVNPATLKPSRFASLKNWMGDEAAANITGLLAHMLGSATGNKQVGQLAEGVAKSVTSSVGKGDPIIKDLMGKNNLKGMGVGMLTSSMGNLLGNSVGGDAGTILSGVTGNFGNSIAGAMQKGKTFSEGVKNFTKVGNLGLLGAGIGSAILDAHTAHSRYSGAKGDLAAGVDMAGGAVGLATGTNIYGTLGMSAVNAITGGTDGMTTQDALLGSSAVAGALTAANPIAGLAYIGLSGINSGLGGKSESMKHTGWQDQEELADMWEGYAGSHAEDLKALDVANKKYGFTSNSARHSADDRVRTANKVRNNLLKIGRKNEIAQIRANKMIDLNNLQYQIDVNGGYNLKYNRLGKNGMKLPSKDDILKVRAILAKGGKIQEEEYYLEAELPEKEVDTFKDGGQLNVIPEGNLHARLHHMENAEGLTKKGIPVVDKEGEQQAEIERDEIIFRKEVTSKLEELMKDGSDKAAIEAGKLLVEEIFNNTDDRTGLIAEITGEEPVPEEEELLSKMQEGGPIPLELSSKETLEDFINTKINERINSAIKKATTRKTPYMFKNKSWKNCVATATDNFGVPIVLRNTDLAENPEKYGFTRVESDGNIDKLVKSGYGYLILDFNKLKEPNTPGHTVMLVDTDPEGYPLYSYSSGDNDASSMHNKSRYSFNSEKINVFRYIGTPEERKAWEEEYNTTYKNPQKKAEGGTLGLVEELNKLSPEKLEKFSTILKYLNHD